jgi:hypothetical protein
MNETCVGVGWGGRKRVFFVAGGKIDFVTLEDGATPAAGLRVVGRVHLVLVAVEEELAAAALPRVLDLGDGHHPHLLPL